MFYVGIFKENIILRTISVLIPKSLQSLVVFLHFPAMVLQLAINIPPNEIRIFYMSPLYPSKGIH
jgi:hypothetical protein